MKRLSSLLGSVAALSVATVVHAAERPLTDAEKQALIGVSRTEDVVDAYAETVDGDTRLLYAIVIYRAVPLGEQGCMATTVDYMALPNQDFRWEPVFDSVAYRYWPNRNECNGVVTQGSIRLATLIDTETLGKIVSAPHVLERAGAAPVQALDARRLVASE